MSKSALWMALAVTIGLAAILWIWWNRQGHTIRQLARMKLAAEHGPVVEPIVHNDPRFSKLKLAEYTDLGGSLLVEGEVESDGDLSDLKKLVQSTTPPVDICYRVIVTPPEMKKLIKEASQIKEKPD